MSTSQMVLDISERGEWNVKIVAGLKLRVIDTENLTQRTTVRPSPMADVMMKDGKRMST